MLNAGSRRCIGATLLNAGPNRLSRVYWGGVVERGALDTSESAVPGGDVVQRKAPDGVLGRRLTQSPRHLSTVCWGGVVIRWAPITSDSAIPRCGFLGRKQTRGRTYIRPRTWFPKLWLFKNWSSSSRCRRSIWVDRKLSLCDLVREIRDGQRPLLFARSEITIIVRGRRATGRFCGSRSVGVSTCSGRALHSLDFGYQVRVAPVGSPPEFPAGKLIVSSSPFRKLDRAIRGVE